MDGRDKAGTYQDSEVSSLVEDLKRCLPACPHDSINRKKLREAAHRLAMALETPGDTAQRYTYLVRLDEIEGCGSTKVWTGRSDIRNPHW